MQTIISEDRIFQRWDTLPQEVRDAMGSDKTAETLERVYTNLQVPDDKRKFVSLVISYVFMGFVRQEDMPKEIEDATGLDSIHASALTDSIAKNVLNPYQEIIHSPALHASFQAARPLDSIMVTNPVTVPAPAKQEEKKPVPARDYLPNLVSLAPSTGSGQASSPQAGSPRQNSGQAGQVSAQIPPPAPAVQSGVAPTSPFMIHTEAKAMPVIQPPKFKLESMDNASAFGGKKLSATPPPRPAQIEIGKEQLLPAEKVVKLESQQRIVHYSPLTSPAAPPGAYVAPTPASVKPPTPPPAV